MTETCSYCGEQIGDRELKQIKFIDGERYVFHAKKPDGSSCKEEWIKANREKLAEKKANWYKLKSSPPTETNEVVKGLHARADRLETKLDHIIELLEKESGSSED